MAALAGLIFVWSKIAQQGNGTLGIVLFLPIALLAHAYSAWSASKEKRFRNSHLKALWDGCVDRLKRFDEVLKRGRRDSIGDLKEMPITVGNVAESVYRALRKADLVQHEFDRTEKDLPIMPMPSQPNIRDPQSVELFQAADRNLAEYKQSRAAVGAGVQRTEAQAAVFMTTLDTLRMKMLGYRLVGRSPELPSHEFLSAIAEAKLQLQSIDRALDELDMGLYPKTIAAIRTTPESTTLPPAPNLTPPKIEDPNIPPPFRHGVPAAPPKEPQNDGQHLEGRG